MYGLFSPFAYRNTVGYKHRCTGVLWMYVCIALRHIPRGRSARSHGQCVLFTETAVPVYSPAGRL